MPEIHNPTVIGDMTLTRPPSAPEHPVRLQDLDARVQAAVAFVTDITSTDGGIVANKVFAPTVPANKILTSAVSDSENLRIHVLAEGRVFTAPEVTVNGESVANFTVSEGNLYQGYVDLNLTESGEITVTSTSGYSSTVTLALATEGPVIQTATIGALPGTQTELKQGDVGNISGIVANDAVSIAVQNAGAASSGNISNLGAVDSAGAGFRTFSGTFTAANRSGAQVVTLVATNALGTAGEAVDTVNTVTLNQTAPTIGTIGISYPNGQSALTNGDTAQVSSTVTGADSVSYAFNAAGQTATIEQPDDYATVKNVTLSNGTYFAGNNYTITAVKASNGATTTRSGAIRIAESEATATVSVQGNPARLRTSAEGVAYTLRIQPDQLLAEEPVVVLDHGTFTGNWSFSGGVYSRQFTVSDSDPRGVSNVEVTLTNLANTESLDAGSFTIGGLVERVVVFDAYARYQAIGTNIGDFSKVRARYSGTGSDLTRRSDTTDVANSFTIVDENGLYDPNGGYLFISDAAFAGANTSGTLQLDLEETI